MSLTYTIIGTGALGGYYGAQLARSGCRVNFLLHSDFAYVQRHGLRVDLAPTSDSYTLTPDTHDVNFFGQASDLPKAEVVLVCLKTTQNHLMRQVLLPGVVSGDALVITMQNGLHPERDVAAVVEKTHVAGALCFLCSNKLGPGHISYLDYGFIKLGAHSPHPGVATLATLATLAKLEQIAADFRGAGVACSVVDDLVLARWQKLVWNVPYNGLSVVLNMTTDRMMADHAVRQRVVALMHEVAAAAFATDGKVIDPAFIETMLSNTARMAPYKTSMMLDHEAGRPMEVDAIVRDPVVAAEARGCAIPQMRRLLDELRAVAH